MQNNYSNKLLAVLAFLSGAIISCSNGSSGNVTPIPNQVPISIGSGMNGDGINTMYISLTVCANNSGTNCHTVDNVILDTGSFGVKINKSALPESFVLSLPRVTTNAGNEVYACNTFGSGYVFADEHYAALNLAGTMTGNVILQVIENSPTAEIPDSCTAKGPFDDFANFGANGIIGINPAITLSNNSLLLYKNINGIYEPLTNAEEVGLPVLNQNPLPSLTTNSNGFVVSIPPVPQNTNTNVNGTLILGINTETNNQITSQTNLVVASESDLSVVCNSACFYSKITNPESTIPAVFDSGTNGWVFMSNTLPQCDYGYCPESPTIWTSSVYSYDFAANESYTISATISADEVVNGQSLSFAVMPGWGYYNYNNQTLYGSPFFLGKNVYVVFPGTQNRNPIWGFESM